MNISFKLNMNGKILEVIKPNGTCFVKIKVNSFLLDFPCPENCEFRLEDEILIEAELICRNICSKENLNQISNKTEVQNDR